MTVDEENRAVVAIATSTAEIVAKHFGCPAPVAWAIGGQGPDGVALFSPEEFQDMAAKADLLAEFVRGNPLAPVESLFIYAAGRDIHPAPSTAWLEVPFWWQLAYTSFAATILESDRAIAEERARRINRALQQAPAPIAAALLADPRDTILEEQPDPLAVRSDAVLVTINEVADVSASVDPIAPAGSPGHDDEANEPAEAESETQVSPASTEDAPAEVKPGKAKAKANA